MTYGTYIYFLKTKVIVGNMFWFLINCHSCSYDALLEKNLEIRLQQV